IIVLDRSDVPVKGYTCIEFKSKQQDKTIELQPNHQNDDSPYRTVDFIIISKIVHIVGEPQGGDDKHQGSQQRTWCQKSRLFAKSRSVLIDYRDHGIEYQYR